LANLWQNWGYADVEDKANSNFISLIMHMRIIESSFSRRIFADLGDTLADLWRNRGYADVEDKANCNFLRCRSTSNTNGALPSPALSPFIPTPVAESSFLAES
jgi:hypothetical protein